MTSLKDLSSEEIQTVHEWLRTMGMPVNRKLNRNYSDAVLMAKLLKKLYPRLVDVQSYHTHINHDLKLINWQMLHFKVLSRIGLSLNHKHLHDLAKGESGLLERLLWEVMALSRKKKSLKKQTTELVKKTLENKEIEISLATEREHKKPKKETDKPIVKDEISDAISIPKVKSTLSKTTVAVKPNSDKIVDITEQGMVPFAVYEGVISEVRAKENTIKAYKTKVAILERLIRERDSEINYLKKNGRYTTVS